METWQTIVITLITALVSAIVAYLVGKLQHFRQRKIEVYEQELPLVISAACVPDSVSDTDLSKALVRMWLMANMKTAKAISKAMSCLVNPDRGSRLEALQEAILMARKDIQFWPQWRFLPQAMTTKDISHFFIRLPKKT